MSILRVKPIDWSFARELIAQLNAATCAVSNCRHLPANDQKMLLTPFAFQVLLQPREIFSHVFVIIRQHPQDFDPVAKSVFADCPKAIVFLPQMGEPAKFIDQSLL